MVLPPAIASIISLPAKGLLGYCIGVAQWFASIPFAQIKQSLTGQMVAIFYALTLLFSWLLYSQSKQLTVRDSLLAGVHISSPFDRRDR